VRTVDVEIVVPVFNEEADLGPSVLRLHAFLQDSFPFRTLITIADNASTDGTWQLATELASSLAGVRAVHLDAKGRGRALQQVWSTSSARVVAYMDVDLSTNLNALLPLVAPLISGHSDLAIGSRLATGARTVRSPKRELISRCYNVLLHAVLGTKVKDAQCGFKAMRADVACDLLPAVQDQDWFFDTELLVQAQRAGLRIHEVPVDWIEDPDTRVEIVPTAIEDLRGVWRLSSALRSFAVIGLISTIAYILCFGALRMFLPAAIANAVSQLLTAVANTAAYVASEAGSPFVGLVAGVCVGALIALRKSGGLKFSSREIVVYPDGRVTYDGGDTAKSALTRAAM